ncbi:hypothetical protein P389DRAFT_171826 [Cystobasidium minutum MCA 4210]|uniref:uncharacterized protein n=1 Tax=Cystobasidium minutum MCA 4210 TaxID=1397322 RepID=UPI0034CE9C9C|eukprot:jgi/Rhomi1/171826/fgenesh1_kg.4_\
MARKAPSSSSQLLLLPVLPGKVISVLPVLFLLLLLSASFTHAHGGHGHDTHYIESPENQQAPIDTILRLHIIFESLAWGFLFPIGMVLGLSKSRYHVPLQVTTTIISIGGMQLARKHGGRQFSHANHGNFAPWLLWLMIVQASIGIYLKMHIMEGSSIRWFTVKVHGILGRLYPVVGYAQMVLGVILGLDICGGTHLGQCLAHFIMGSSFIGYGIIILIMSMYGSPWLEEHNISQEFMDSTVIMTFGIFITFTMHGFIEPAHGGWSHKDMQHTAMGVLFWTGGALGMWLGRNRKRNIWPALVVALTGFAMSGHEQETMLSTNVHAIFGYTLMAAGICRIIEICFVLREGHDAANQTAAGQMSAFQHLTPFLLIVGGLEFMSATEEQLDMIGRNGMDHVTYIVIMFCMAFGIYLWSNLLISLYHNSGKNASRSTPEDGSSRPESSLWRLLVNGAKGHYNGSALQEPKLDEYSALPNSARADDDSIELGNRSAYLSGRGASRNTAAHPAGSVGIAMFDADLEARNSDDEDDGGDAYWAQHDLDDEGDAEEIRVR